MTITIPYYEDMSRVSNSYIGYFKKSPKLFRDSIDGKIKSDPTKPMENGTMVHMYLLQNSDFFKEYKILDFDTPSSAQQKKFCEDYISSTAEKPILKALEAFKSNYSTNGKNDEESGRKGLEMALKLKDYIKFLRGKESGKKIISFATLNALKKKQKNVLDHKKANELLTYKPTNGFDSNEFHINWEWKMSNNPFIEEKIDCKSLLDRIVVDHDNKKIQIIDVKTTISVSDFKKSFDEYDYGRQLAFYWMAVIWYLEKDLGLDITGYSHETYIIAVDNITHECRVFNIDDDILMKKADELKDILNDIYWHMQNGKWDYSRVYYEGDGSESLNCA